MQKVLLFFISLFFSIEANSQVVELVKVINPTGWAYPDSFQVYNDKLYFAADDGVHGRELWVTDGTEQGTKIVKDIKVKGSSFPQNLTVFKGKLFFRAIDDSNGFELWETDGTEEGTKLFADLNPNGTSYPNQLFVFDSIMVFSANSDGINGSEVWKTNGTKDGTSIIIQSDTTISNSSSIKGFVEFKDRLYFTGNFGNNRAGFWFTDGNIGGTDLVKDSAGYPVGLSVVASGDFNLSLLATSDKLFFRGNSIKAKIEPWVSDGTSKGTFMLKDINPNGDSHPLAFTSYKDKVYFGAYTTKAPDNITGIFVTDGTTTGTSLLRRHHEYIPYHYKVYNEYLFYTGSDSSTGLELYISDGTETGTQLFKDILSTWHGLPNNYFIYNGLLYFSAFAGQGCQLWRSDGTQSGTFQVPLSFTPYKNAIIGEEYKQYIEYNGSVYFSAHYDSAQKNQLWRLRDTTFSRVQQDASENSTLSIYPNPANDYVTTNIENIYWVTFRNLLGKEVLSHNFHLGRKIDVSHLPSGIYFVTSDANHKPIKFIKK